MESREQDDPRCWLHKPWTVVFFRPAYPLPEKPDRVHARAACLACLPHAALQMRRERTWTKAGRPSNAPASSKPCSRTEPMTDGLSRVSAGASLGKPHLSGNRPRIGGNARTRGLRKRPCCTELRRSAGRRFAHCVTQFHRTE